MDRQTVFTIESDDLGWPSTRQALARLPATRLVGSTACRDDVVELATAANPDAIVAAWRVEERSIIPVLRQLRPRLPRATFVILAHDHDPNELLALDDVGISGYLLWRDLRGPRLSLCLGAALRGEVVVVSSVVADAYIVAQRQRWNPGPAAPPLSERQRAVLRGLAEGLTQEAIAALLDVHTRTVEATVADLKRQLGATSEFTLAAQAMRRGYLA